MPPPQILDQTITQLTKILKSPGARKIPGGLHQDACGHGDAATQFVSQRICPIFQVPMTGECLDLVRIFLNILPHHGHYDDGAPFEFHINDTFSVPATPTAAASERAERARRQPRHYDRTSTGRRGPGTHDDDRRVTSPTGRRHREGIIYDTRTPPYLDDGEQRRRPPQGHASASASVSTPRSSATQSVDTDSPEYSYMRYLQEASRPRDWCGLPLSATSKRSRASDCQDQVAIRYQTYCT